VCFVDLKIKKLRKWALTNPIPLPTPQNPFDHTPPLLNTAAADARESVTVSLGPLAC
jgi:hypothetical protein